MVKGFLGGMISWNRVGEYFRLPGKLYPSKRLVSEFRMQFRG
jgi:hypothetical protein